MSESNENKIQELLEVVNIITKEYEENARKTGNRFNIFDIAGIGWKEVPVCRVIAELLSPTGNHQLGGAYLKLFLANCLGIHEYTRNEIDKAKVVCEYRTDKRRRIDIAIRIKGCFIPIEAKIYAVDLERQLEDYYKFAVEKFGDKAKKIVYLTLDGRKPSEDSIGNLSDTNCIETISFKDEILSWLNKCLELKETDEKPPVREVLKQFKSVIENLTNQWKDKKDVAIADLLYNSEDYMRSAKAIMDNMETCRYKMFTKFFDSFEEKFKIEFEKESGTKLERIYAEWDYDYNKYSTNSAEITYMYDEDIYDSISVVFMLCCNKYDYLTAGYALVKKEGDGIYKRFGDKGIADRLRNERYHIEATAKKSDWYIAYEHIELNENGEGINLTDFSKNYENYFKLFNEEKFNEIVDNTVEQTIKIYEYVKKQDIN